MPYYCHAGQHLRLLVRESIVRLCGDGQSDFLGKFELLLLDNPQKSGSIGGLWKDMQS